MRLLCDTNIILDVILKREPFYTDSAHAMILCEEGDVEGLVPVSSLTDIYYIVRRQTGDNKVAYTAVEMVCDIMFPCPASDRAALKALENKDKDFEDSLVAEIAIENTCDYILTRDKKGFEGCSIKTLTPSELIELFP